MKQVEKKKGISKIAWIIIIVVVIAIIVGIVVFVNSRKEKQQPLSEHDVLLQEIISMVDRYDQKRFELLTKTQDINKVKDSDFDDIVYLKYKSQFKATKNGIYFIGDNEEQKEIAKQLGLEILEEKPNKPRVKNVISFQDKDTVYMTAEYIDSKSGVVTYNFKFREDGGQYKDNITDKNEMIQTNLEQGKKYWIMLEITDRDNHKVVSPEYSITLTKY